MFEKYKNTGKHRKGTEGLVDADEVIEKASVPIHGSISDRPLVTTDERIDLATSPSIAFQEVITDTDSDPLQTIRNVDLALKHFNADDFTDHEKAVLTDIVVKSSEEILHKTAGEEDLPANDFTDPIVLGSAVDVLHELHADASDTGPILEGIVTVVENISDPTKNADHAIKLNPEEAQAFVATVREFEHMPTGHHTKLLELLDDSLRRIEETRIAYHELQYDHIKIKKKPQPLKDIRRSVDRYHDKQMLRQRRALGSTAGKLVTSGARSVARKKHVA